MIEWLAMGGYWGYVWGSYGVAVIVLVGELTLLRMRFRQALRQARMGGQDGA